MLLVVRFLGKFFFNIYCIAGNVFAALAKEEPNEKVDKTAEDKESDLDWGGPTGSRENNDIDEAEAEGIEMATSEEEFFGEEEILFDQ